MEAPSLVKVVAPEIATTFSEYYFNELTMRLEQGEESRVVEQPKGKT
jgi:hypothetical protein